MLGVVDIALFSLRIPRVLRAVALLLAVFTAPAAAATEIVIGTGSILGVYFQAGRGICDLVEMTTDGVECSAVPSRGSTYNLHRILKNEIQVGIVQSDVQHKLYMGTGAPDSAGAGYKSVRTLFSLHGEPFTLVARRDSGIRSLADLEGRKVNLGNPGSGQRATMQVVMDAMGWTEKSFSEAGELPASQQSRALCNGQIEAMVYVVGHPNKSIQKATERCNTLLVNVEGPQIDRLVAKNPYYSYVVIPGGIYKGNEAHVKTFGVRATVMVSQDLDADFAYAITKAVFDNLDRFRKMHPVFGVLDRKVMITEGLTAPLHPGAVRYYRKNGLLP